MLSEWTIGNWLTLCGVIVAAVEEILATEPDDIDATNRKGNILKLQGNLVGQKGVTKKL